jgi:hypothetical protein
MNRIKLAGRNIIPESRCSSFLPRSVFPSLFMVSFALMAQRAEADPVVVVNADFDAEAGSLGADNQFNFSNPVPGWDKIRLSTGAIDNSITNNGTINIPPSDIPDEALSEPLALYVQELANVVRFDQTTSHVISANDTVLSLAVSTGNDRFFLDANVDRFGGAALYLYAFDGTTKSILRSATFTTQATASWAPQSLTVIDDVGIDLDPFVGQQLGIGLGTLGQTFIHPAVPDRGPLAGIVFYDNVSLDVTTVPEPAGIISLFGAMVIACTARLRRDK